MQLPQNTAGGSGAAENRVNDVSDRSWGKTLGRDPSLEEKGGKGGESNGNL